MEFDETEESGLGGALSGFVASASSRDSSDPLFRRASVLDVLLLERLETFVSWWVHRSIRDAAGASPGLRFLEEWSEEIVCLISFAVNESFLRNFGALAQETFMGLGRRREDENSEKMVYVRSLLAAVLVPYAARKLIKASPGTGALGWHVLRGLFVVAFANKLTKYSSPSLALSRSELIRGSSTAPTLPSSPWGHTIAVGASVLRWGIALGAAAVAIRLGLRAIQSLAEQGSNADSTQQLSLDIHVPTPPIPNHPTHTVCPVCHRPPNEPIAAPTGIVYCGTCIPVPGGTPVYD